MRDLVDTFEDSGALETRSIPVTEYTIVRRFVSCVHTFKGSSLELLGWSRDIGATSVIHFDVLTFRPVRTVDEGAKRLGVDVRQDLLDEMATL